MNEKLQNSLAEVVQFLLQWAKETKEFVNDQAPLVVREAIAYGRAVETWEMFVCVVFLGVGLMLLTRNYSRVKFSTDSRSPRIFEDGTTQASIKLVLGALFTFCGTVSTFHQAPDFFMAWFAPRLYVLKWAAELLKTIKG